jgi:hypothetical protein
MLCNMSFVQMFRNCYNVRTRIKKNKATAVKFSFFLNDKCNRVTVPLHN